MFYQNVYTHAIFDQKRTVIDNYFTCGLIRTSANISNVLAKYLTDRNMFHAELHDQYPIFSQ